MLREASMTMNASRLNRQVVKTTCRVKETDGRSCREVYSLGPKQTVARRLNRRRLWGAFSYGAIVVV